MRGKKAKKRKQVKDAKYDSQLVSRFINKIMQHGKKAKAEAIFYKALENGAKKAGVDPLEFIGTAVDNIRPSLELRARRVGGANYQVPVPVTAHRQETLVIRWIVDAARKDSGASFDTILQKAFFEAFNGEGAAVKKKEDTERMAEANKAFAHFKW
jgi:small subunit ribosomal protein S7